jgi:hypothetical protein
MHDVPPEENAQEISAQVEAAIAGIHLPDHMVADAHHSRGQAYWDRLRTTARSEVLAVYHSLGLPDPGSATIEGWAGRLIREAIYSGPHEERTARLSRTSTAVLAPKDAYVHLLDQLQRFFATSMTWLSALSQADVPLVSETIDETTDEQGKPTTYIRFTNSAKVEALLNNCLHGVNAVLRLGRYNVGQAVQSNLSELWSKPVETASDPNYLAIDLDATLRETVGDREYNLFHMRMTGTLVISMAYEAAKRYRFTHRGTPELEFLFHLRNAVSHDNTFNFQNQQPRSPATFSHFTVDASLQGFHPVLFQYMLPGDIYDLLEFLKTHT